MLRRSGQASLLVAVVSLLVLQAPVCHAACDLSIFCTGKSPGVYCNPDDSGSYLECTAGSAPAKLHPCPAGYQFSKKGSAKGYCSYKEAGECDIVCPTLAPTLAPTPAPTVAPTPAPTVAPTAAPTDVGSTTTPTQAPSEKPSSPRPKRVDPPVCPNGVFCVGRSAGYYCNPLDVNSYYFCDQNGRGTVQPCAPGQFPLWIFNTAMNGVFNNGQAPCVPPTTPVAPCTLSCDGPGAGPHPSIAPTPAPTVTTPAPTVTTPAPTVATPAPTVATPAPTPAPTDVGTTTTPTMAPTVAQCPPGFCVGRTAGFYCNPFDVNTYYRCDQQGNDILEPCAPGQNPPWIFNTAMNGVFNNGMPPCVPPTTPVAPCTLTCTAPPPTMTPAPVTVTPAPVTVTPAPVTVTPAPVTTTPMPTAAPTATPPPTPAPTDVGTTTAPTGCPDSRLFCTGRTAGYYCNPLDVNSYYRCTQDGSGILEGCAPGQNPPWIFDTAFNGVFNNGLAPCVPPSTVVAPCTLSCDGASTPAPTVATPAPTVVTPAPTVFTPAPTVVTPAPTVVTPAPTVATPAPTVVTPAPTTLAPIATPAPVGTPAPTLAPTLAPTPAPVATPTAAPTDVGTTETPTSAPIACKSNCDCPPAFYCGGNKICIAAPAPVPCVSNCDCERTQFCASIGFCMSAPGSCYWGPTQKKGRKLADASFY